MIRVVLDTNVLVSAMISPFGNPAQVLISVQDGKITPLFSEKMLAEYAEVLARPKFSFEKSEIDGLNALLRATGLLMRPERMVGASPDPKDDEFIACARAGEADFLVTGNKRHFPAESYGSARVVSPRKLIEYLNTLQSP
jgi:putative PIN family toxin of toxin-antitoxin system